MQTVYSIIVVSL